MAIVSKAAKRVQRFLNLPGYDMDTEEAIKELTKKQSKEGLTPREERKLDRLMNEKARQESAETPEGMAREKKAKPLTEKEKKQMQESLEFKKGGMVKKPAAKKPAVKKMAKGGMSTANKGGAGMANCGASMKPAQKAKK